MSTTRLRRCRTRVAVLVPLLLSAEVAMAHVPMLRGKLIDLVQRSDVVVIGTVDSVRAVGARQVDTMVRVQRQLVGAPSDSTLTFRGATRFAPRARYVFFLRHGAAGFEGIQDSGTVFPATPEDDTFYEHVVESTRHALSTDFAHRVDALCSAMIPALSASVPELRYHAALELSALAGANRGQCSAERETLRRLLAEPTLESEVRVLLGPIATH